jgi:periplasmic divalent cation tolerance protein
MTDTIQVVTVTSGSEEARRIASALVERRLAACVQVAGPVTSTYRWKGKIESAQEFLCIIKTRQSHYLAVEDAIRELHTYEVPEILAMPVSAGNRDYLDWLRDELADLSGPQIV